MMQLFDHQYEVASVVNANEQSESLIWKPSKHTLTGHHRPISEMPFKWHFTDGPILA